MPIFETQADFYSKFEMPLARAMYHIEQRGLRIDTAALAVLRKQVDDEIAEIKSKIALLVPSGEAATLNLNSPQQIIRCLESMGIRIPKNRTTGKDTTSEDALFKLYGETGNEFLQHILRHRELQKVKGTYLETELHDNVLYCSYVTTGTKTGRRSSRASFNGLGTNHQNLPKHSVLAKKFRKCIVARPGKVFVACDQMTAEDWVISGLIADQSGIDYGIQQLRKGVADPRFDRHAVLASSLFARPVDECGKDPLTHSDTIFRYLAKRTRYAGSFGMRENTMSESMAKEGMAVPPPQCKLLLVKFHHTEPWIEKVFQFNVEQKLLKEHKLVNPIGRVRQSLGLRPYGNNNDTFREFYAQIPQSTVGDNTGLAILHVERNAPGLCVADGHDAVYLEVDDNSSSIASAVDLLTSSFDRVLTFPNGFQIQIPIEFEVGDSFGTMQKPQSPTKEAACDVSTTA